MIKSNTFGSIKIQLSFIVAFLFFTISSISKVLLLIGIPREVTYALYLIVLMIFITKTFRKMDIFDCLIYFIILSSVAIGLFDNWNYIETMTNRLAPIILMLPTYYVFRIINNSTILKAFELSAYINALYLLIFYHFNFSNESHYSMDYAYTAALPLCAFMFMSYNKHKIWHIVISVVLFVTIVVSGNRGAMLLPLLCGSYYIISDISKNNKKKLVLLLSIFVCFVLGIIVSFQYENIISYLETAFPNSRNITKLLTGELFVSHTRETLYDYCIQLIKQKPFGYGPMGSRPYMIYPHSLLLELVFDYGCIIGFIIFASIIYMGISNLWTYRLDEFREITGIVTLLGLGSLCVSSSLYYEIFVPATISIFTKNHPKKSISRKIVED